MALTAPKVITRKVTHNTLVIQIDTNNDKRGDTVSVDYALNGGALTGAVLYPVRADHINYITWDGITSGTRFKILVVYKDSTLVEADSSTVTHVEIILDNKSLFPNGNFDSFQHLAKHGQHLHTVVRRQEPLAIKGAVAAGDVDNFPAPPGDAYRIIGDSGIGKTIGYDQNNGSRTVRVENPVVEEMISTVRYLSDTGKTARFVANHAVVGVTNLVVGERVVNTTNFKVYTVVSTAGGTTGNTVSWDNGLLPLEEYKWTIRETGTNSFYRFQGGIWDLVDNYESNYIEYYQDIIISKTEEPTTLHYL